MKEQTYEVRGATIRVIARTRYDYSNRGWREHTSEPRMYVSVADETLLDNLMNRTRRPYNVYKTMIHSSAIDQVLNLDGMRWSQKAGCTLCPCSPGFIIPRQGVRIGDELVQNFDVWVKLIGAPAVDERKAARVIAFA